MLTTLDRARLRWNRATHRLGSLPVLVLMPHSRCNCRCVMCDIWKANASLRQLTAEDLEPHLRSLRSMKVRWVVLSGGEPLLHENLWTLCEAVAALGARTTLLSTGLLLRPHAAAITDHVADVVVSLDGPAGIHDEIRRIPRAFEKLGDGIAALREQDPEYPVTGRCVLQRQNFRHLLETVDAALDLGLDQISFFPADVSSEAFNRPGGWGEDRASDVALTPEQTAELERLVETLVRDRPALFERGFVAESPQKLRRIPAYFRALNNEAPLPPVQCNAPWVSSVVEADGSVRPCFFHPRFAHLDDGPLAELLNSPAAVAFRRGLDVARDPVCQRCVCSLNL